MTRVFAALLLCVPGWAQALSCLPWGVSNAYQAAEVATGAYVPVLGTLVFDTAALPLANLRSERDLPTDATIPARFDGHALVRGGKDVPFQTNITLSVTCAAHWCGSAKPGKVLALLRKGSNGYVADQGPCGGNVFSRPTRDQIRQMRSCLDGGPCEAISPVRP